MKKGLAVERDPKAQLPKVGRKKVCSKEFLEEFNEKMINNYGMLNKTIRDMGIGKTLFYYWMSRYPDFRDYVHKLQDECRLIKQELYEEKLIESVEKGNAQCVIFANKTYNKDRGYGEKNEIDVKGDIEVKWDNDED